MPYTFWTIAGLTILLLLAPTPSPAHSATPGLPVPFLEAPPQIDGELDATLANIPAASFAAVKTTSPQCLVVPVHYRLAYGSTFLYLYIEVADEQPIHRDRGYQNGDGFHMVLAAPRPDDGPSDEFYVLGFAGGEAESASFDRFVWYHDIALSFTPLSEVTRFARHSGGGKTGYELLLPWSEIPPYHPWTSSAIGFNLCFVKAVGTTDKVYHFVHTDDRMQWEQSPRLYEPLEFLPPVLTGGQQTVLMPDRGNGKAGETLTATQVTLAATAMTVPLNVRLLTGDGAAVTTRSEFVCHSGLNHRRVELPTASLPAEGIRLLWSTHGTAVEGENALSILPATEPAMLRARLTDASARLAPGSRDTLEFQLELIMTQLAAMRPHQTCGPLRLQIAEFIRLLEQAERGIDPIATRRGLLRRAFRSGIDGTLQPYSIKVPEKLEDHRRYSLVVFLHGSGHDDVGTLDNLPSLPGTILMAPRARGTSHWYMRDHAQEDIAEALADTLANYPVDPQRVYLAGFSMGGYGVYRTFFKDPAKYRGLIVLAGLPRIPGNKQPLEAIDFTRKEHQKKFRGVPLFIAHGTADLNCPFLLTAGLVKELKRCGARVEFMVEPGVGHTITPAMLLRAGEWLAKQLPPEPIPRP